MAGDDRGCYQIIADSDRQEVVADNIVHHRKQQAAIADQTTTDYVVDIGRCQQIVTDSDR